MPSIQSVSPTGLLSSKSPNVPLISRVYLQLGTWQWALSPGLDDISIKGILSLVPLISWKSLHSIQKRKEFLIVIYKHNFVCIFSRNS